MAVEAEHKVVFCSKTLLTYTLSKRFAFYIGNYLLEKYVFLSKLTVSLSFNNLWRIKLNFLNSENYFRNPNKLELLYLLRKLTLSFVFLLIKVKNIHNKI